MSRSSVSELAFALSARIRRGHLSILVAVLLQELHSLAILLVSCGSGGGHMRDRLGKSLSLLLLRNLSLLLLLLLEDLMHLAPLPGLVLDPEHGRPFALVDVVIAEVSAGLEIVSPVVLNLEELSLVLFHESGELLLDELHAVRVSEAGVLSPIPFICLTDLQ
jgi:hypothetical protein